MRETLHCRTAYLTTVVEALLTALEWLVSSNDVSRDRELRTRMLPDRRVLLRRIDCARSAWYPAVPGNHLDDRMLLASCRLRSTEVGRCWALLGPRNVPKRSIREHVSKCSCSHASAE